MAVALGVVGAALLIVAIFLALFVEMSRAADKTNPWRNCTYMVDCKCAGCEDIRKKYG